MIVSRDYMDWAGRTMMIIILFVTFLAIFIPFLLIRILIGVIRQNKRMWISASLFLILIVSGITIIIFRYQKDASVYVKLIKNQPLQTNEQPKTSFEHGLNIIGNVLETNQKVPSESKLEFQHQTVPQFTIISPQSVIPTQQTQSQYSIQWTNPKRNNSQPQNK